MNNTLTVLRWWQMFCFDEQETLALSAMEYCQQLSVCSHWSKIKSIFWCVSSKNGRFLLFCAHFSLDFFFGVWVQCIHVFRVILFTRFTCICVCLVCPQRGSDNYIKCICLWHYINRILCDHISECISKTQ